MTVYLLDTGIVVGFQKAGHLDALVQAASRVSLAIVEEVYDEIVTDAMMTKHRAAATEAKELIGTSRMVVRSLKLASVEAATHAAIRAGKTSATADIGESASIALAAHDGDVIFVTNDAAASLLALQELRGRTMSFHPFLAMLVDSAAMAADKCATIAADIQKARDWRVKEPAWWVEWLKSQR
jgi:hypothetical protein